MNFGKFFVTVLAILILTAAVFSASGDLDTGFNPVLSPMPNVQMAIVNQVVAQADGKILIAGAFSAVGGVPRNGIARLNADGSLDTSFNPGMGAADANVDSLAVAPDGKILVGGAFTSFNGTARQRVARLNADGSLDTTFVPPTAAMTNRINAIAVQSDGKVLVGVALSTIKRLNTDGTLDTTFNTSMTPQVGVIEIKLQADGKILIGGGWDFLNGAEYRFGLARLNENGDTDNSFVPHANKFSLNGAAVAEIIPQADGKVIAVGNLRIDSTVNNKHIVRFNANGTVDNTFDSGADTNNTIFSAVRQADGKILIVGSFTSFNGTAVKRMARLNSDGTLDSSFNANIDNNTIYSTVQQPDGKILIGGYFTQVNSTPRTGLARLQSAVPSKTATCDYDGDGKTDFALRRVTSGQFWWYIGLSGGGASRIQQWGKSGDTVVCGDYDGDSKTDLTVWRSGAALTAGFYILQSADNTVRFEQFGQSQDNATVVGDYDGDGKTDVAVYRNGANAGEQSYFYYRGSANNPNGNVTYIPWGIQFDRPYTGDFDGDGKSDIAVQRNINSVSTHFIRQSADNSLRIAYLGLNTDSIIPGDYNGDGKTDVALVRNENSNRTWYVTTDFGASYSTTAWGVSNALSAVGDYDGDGKADITVYQNDTNGGGFNFFVLKSSDNLMMTYRWGQNLDFPLAAFNQH